MNRFLSLLFLHCFLIFGTGWAASSNNPTVSITSAASVAEGDSGTTTVTLTVSVSECPNKNNIVIDWATASGSASGGSDFQIASGTVTFYDVFLGLCDKTKNFTVTVIGDTVKESDETFTVTLSDGGTHPSQNFTWGNQTSTITILDDDPTYSNADDLCHGEATRSCLLQLLGICVLSSNTLPIQHINTNGTLENVEIILDESELHVDLGVLEWCGIDGSAGSCQHVSGLYLGLGNIGLVDLISNAIIYDMPNMAPADVNHSIFVKSIVDIDLNTLLLGSGSQTVLYGRYTKNGEDYVGPIYQCAGGGGDSNITFFAAGGVDAVDKFAVNGHALGNGLKTRIVDKTYAPDASSDPTLYSVDAVYLGEDNTTAETNDAADMPVFFYLADANCSNAVRLVDTNGEWLTAVIAKGQIAGSTPAFILDHIARNKRFAMRYIDYEALYTECERGPQHGKDVCQCLLNSQTGQNAVPGLPACVSAWQNYLGAFGQDAYNRCREDINNGQPCLPQNHGYGTGTYAHPYGCYECTLGTQPGVCSSDNFAIRPDRYDADLASAAILTAGDPVPIEFTALSATSQHAVDYNETEDTSFAVDVKVVDPAKLCAQPDIHMTPAVIFENGFDADTFYFDNIGDVNMTVHELNGSEYAVVDWDDTPDDERMITPFIVGFRILPARFIIDGVLKDYSNGNFTYLHDFNASAAGTITIIGIPYDYNNTMGATLEINITAVDANATLPRITTNYQDTCYAKDTNVTLTIDSTDITPTDAVTRFIYYNFITGREGYDVLPSPQTGLTALRIENNESSFPKDGNGTTLIRYKINFNRDRSKVVNPFRLSLTGASVVDTDSITGSITGLSGQDANYFYARVHAPRYRIKGSEGNATIYYEVYSDSPSNTLLTTLLGTNPSRSVDSVLWYRNSNHNRSTDGNVTMTQQLRGGTYVVDHADVSTQPQTTVHDYLYNGSQGYPYKATIRVDTQDWLIYNKFNSSIDYDDFELEFYGEGGWMGTDQEDVTGSGGSDRTNRRIQW